MHDNDMKPTRNRHKCAVYCFPRAFNTALSSAYSRRAQAICMGRSEDVASRECSPRKRACQMLMVFRRCEYRASSSMLTGAPPAARDAADAAAGVAAAGAAAETAQGTPTSPPNAQGSATAAGGALSAVFAASWARGREARDGNSS
jgi:hypothetical protein